MVQQKEAEGNFFVTILATGLVVALGTAATSMVWNWSNSNAIRKLEKNQSGQQNTMVKMEDQIENAHNKLNNFTINTILWLGECKG